MDRKNHQESTTPIHPNLTEGENKRKDKNTNLSFVGNEFKMLIIIVTSLFIHLSCHTYCYHKFEFMIIQGMQLMEENERLRQQV